jgi:hypothetical protein
MNQMTTMMTMKTSLRILLRTLCLGHPCLLILQLQWAS